MASRRIVLALVLLASPVLAYLYGVFTAWIVSAATGIDVYGYLIGQFMAMGFIYFFTLYAALDIYYILFAAKHVSRGEIPEKPPSMTVVIPAYNEEATIADTINSLWRTGYPSLEIIVVDDGSSDSTAEKAAALGARVIRHETNKGRAHAVMTGIKNARGEIVVTVDADTIVEKDALHRIASFFRDKSVGAVCGRLRVVGEEKLLTRWQSIEYSIGYAYTKKIQDAMDWVLIPSGAFSAYRKEAVRDADAYDTVAEDFDIAMNIRRRGYTIRFCENCVAYTKVPSTLSSFIRQRIRWGVGGLQVIAKHGDMLLNKRYGITGVFGLPFHFLIGYGVAPLEFFGILLVLAMTILSPLTRIGNPETLAALLLWLIVMKALGIILITPGAIYASRKLGEKVTPRLLLSYWLVYYYIMMWPQMLSILIYLDLKKISWLTK